MRLDELTRLVDEFMVDQISDTVVPGAVVVVVANGEVLLNKGYGFANLAERELVDPDRTVFRIASISKLLTALTILLAYQQGVIELDGDINSYVQFFRIANQFSEPLTLRHLLTHSGGLDQRYLHTAALGYEDQVPLGEYLRARLPKQVHQPGELMCSSNHGITLAAFALESVTGVHFARYASRTLFGPLGMTLTTFQPHPNEIPDLANGYIERNGQLQPVPFDFLNDYPSGAVVTTGRDMATLLVELTTNLPAERKIFQPATRGLILSKALSHHPLLPGRTLALEESYPGGLRILEQTGSARGFSSLILIEPKSGLGVFVALNKFGDRGLRFGLKKLICDRLGSDDNVAESRHEYSGPIVHGLSGLYRAIRYSRHDLTRLSLLAGYPREISVVELRDQTLQVDQQHFIPIAELVFERQSGDRIVAFRRNEMGSVSHLFIGTAAFEKIDFWDSRIAHLGYFSIFVLLNLGIVVLLATKYRRPRYQNASTKLARRLTGASGIFVLAYFTCIVAVMLDQADPDDPFRIAYPNLFLDFVLLLSWGVVTLLIVAAAATLLSWYKKRLGGTEAHLLPFLNLANLLLLPLFAHWNMW